MGALLGMCKRSSACRGCIKSTKYGGQKKRKKNLLAKWPKKKKKAKANKSQNEKKKG